MSIRQQLDDAKFLAEHGRFLGALTQLLLAVAASSRLTFPKGTQSIEKPGKPMGDGEAFTSFLGGRIRKILFGDFGAPQVGTSGLQIYFRGQQFDIAYVLYKFYRCELVHDGKLPANIEFAPQQKPTNGQLAVGISTEGDRLVLDHGWLALLFTAVVEARCNGKEFGIAHRELVFSGQGSEADFLANLVTKYQATPGRIDILKHGLLGIAPASISGKDDATVIATFRGAVDTGHVPSGAVAGLRSRELSDELGNLSPKGLAALRELDGSYQVVDL